MTEAEQLANLADAFVKSLPVAGAICLCGHLAEEHTQLGKRTIWVCKADHWRCLCIRFQRRG